MADDWVPPAPPTPYWHEDVATPYGVIPRWKAAALAIGEMQTVFDKIRNDDAHEVTPLTEEQKPPELIADAKDEDKEAEARLDAEWLKKVEEAIERIDMRLGLLEQRRRAQDALEDAEREVEALIPPDDETLH